MNNDQLNKLVDDTLNSLDGVQPASPKPYLFTRLTARMQRKNDGAWDSALRFISRPAVAMACVLLVVAINVMVFTMHRQNIIPANSEDPIAAIDGYNGTVSLLRDIENIEP
ncbi:MAG: hypothetical protein U0V75_00600 [Ferruginibacter sp.]